jgi:hypothetical protein
MHKLHCAACMRAAFTATVAVASVSRRASWSACPMQPHPKALLDLVHIEHMVSRIARSINGGGLTALI